MISLPDRASLKAALTAPLAPRLHQLLADRIYDAAKTDLLDLTHILVVLPGDCEHTIAEEISMSPLVNPGDGARYGSPAFVPWWDFLEDHGDFFEMVICVGDTGFAFILLIQADGVQPELLSLCRAHAE